MMFLPKATRDILGIENDAIEHHFCADPSTKKVQQKRKSFNTKNTQQP